MRSSRGSWVPDLRSLALARPGHAFSCPGRVQRAHSRERNETGTQRKNREAHCHTEPRARDVERSVMRDLSHDRSLLSINSMTVKAWSLEQLIEGCARAGISAISPWRDVVGAWGPERAGKLIRADDITVTGLCRGGMFPAADDAGRRAALDDNRRAIDEAAAIGAQCLVLVVGGLPKGGRAPGGRRAPPSPLPSREKGAGPPRDGAAAPDVCRRPRLREHARAGERP